MTKNNGLGDLLLYVEGFEILWNTLGWSLVAKYFLTTSDVKHVADGGKLFVD